MQLLHISIRYSLPLFIINFNDYGTILKEDRRVKYVFVVHTFQIRYAKAYVSYNPKLYADMTDRELLLREESPIFHHDSEEI